MKRLVDEQKDGWMDGSDGWMDAGMNESINQSTDGWMFRWVNGWVRWASGWIYG